MKNTDVLIVGGGPAGMTAAIYARRFGKSVTVIEKETIGGQITHSPRVENYPGFVVMSGVEFADKLSEQMLAQEADFDLDEIVCAEKADGGFKLTCESGEEYFAKTVIIATGSRHRTLGLEREEEFEGVGVSYCAVCDGAFYKGKRVAIIGGGNTALQEAVMLSEICKHVTIVQNLEMLTGEASLQKIIASRDNIDVIYGSRVTKLVGEGELESIVINNGNEDATLDVDGIFVAIGQVPENGVFAELCELDERGYIISGEDCMTKTPGVFAAGDCRTKKVRQVTTATADGAVSAVNAVSYIDAM